MTEKIGNVTLNYSYYKEGKEYNEGDDVENKVLEIVKTTDDYTQALINDNRWPILYQLSKQRENIIEPLDINKNDNVLEIGAGMGAVTGAIARRCKKVDCIELSKRRSLANAYRNKNFDNIEIFVGNFQDVEVNKKYDVVTLIGVLEYACYYIESENPFDDFLKKAAGCLKPEGKLYVAIENKLGLKYFAGCCEDHLGKPFVGIEGYEDNDRVKTFSKSELENLILKNGFKSTYFYYPFPDYKLPIEIYSDDYFPENMSYIPTIVNYDLDRLICFDESKVYKSLAKSEEIKILSNSFLVEAVKK